MEITRIAAAVILLFAVSDAADRVITGYMDFYYDPPSEYFLMRTTSKCYIAPLTRVEKDHVRSNQGIEDLELTYVREWLGALNETMIYHNDPSLPVKFQDLCKYNDILYLNRVIPTSATASSIFG